MASAVSADRVRVREFRGLLRARRAAGEADEYVDLRGCVVRVDVTVGVTLLTTDDGLLNRVNEPTQRRGTEHQPLAFGPLIKKWIKT